ncbi:MAG: V-type ATP synthase subunit E family protein [Candidatus Thermoplasmatota archaeon]|nr:V-type ATP synthase subunit E family protein [Candidatus Thermoplasmatota archaeon]
MSLEKLAKDIAAQAEAEASEIIAEAKAEAKRISKGANSEVAAISSDAMASAEKQAAQIGVESVASARQSNQKDILIAKRVQIDLTYDAVREKLGSPKLSKRSAMLDSLLKEAKAEAKGKMTLRPASIDRSALEQKASDFTLGDDIEALGGFMLVSNDGSISLDYTFDSKLNDAWLTSLGDVNQALFGA